MSDKSDAQQEYNDLVQAEIDQLPEYYSGENGARVRAPTYEALMPCQIIMTSAETGLTGPTRIEAGEHFTTDSTPCHQWAPLNKAAAKRLAAWVGSLPQSGQGFSQEEITEAAYAMRPREGEKEIPHEQWWPAVLRYAAVMKEKRGGGLRNPTPRPAQAHRRGAVQPTMPFAQNAPALPLEAGRGPANPGDAGPVPANAAQRARGGRSANPAPMPGATRSDAPSQTATS